MKITWSLPMRSERLESSRGDLVRARRLVEALRRESHDVRVVEEAARPGLGLTVSAYRKVVRRVLPLPIALVLRDAGRWLHARRHGRRVAAEALEQGAEVIIETQVNFATSGALAARITGLPLVLDDCGPSSEEVVLGAGLPGVAHRVLKGQMRAASVIVAVSRALREQLIEEGAPQERIYIIPNGADIEAFAAIDRQAARENLGLTDRCVIGFVGSFQPWHRVDLLVDVFARLRRDQALHLLLVGDGQEKESVMDAVQRLGLRDRVTAVGAVSPSRVPELIAAFDVGVLPGCADYQHPMKLVEYAAAGVAPVAPDLAPIREVLQDGVTGLLFPPGDAGALASVLARLSADRRLRADLGRRARSHVAAGASWIDRARILQSLLPRRRTIAAGGSSNRVG